MSSLTLLSYLKVSANDSINMSNCLTGTSLPDATKINFCSFSLIHLALKKIGGTTFGTTSICLDVPVSSITLCFNGSPTQINASALSTNHFNDRILSGVTSLHKTFVQCSVATIFTPLSRNLANDS